MSNTKTLTIFGDVMARQPDLEALEDQGYELAEAVENDNGTTVVTMVRVSPEELSTRSLYERQCWGAAAGYWE